MVNGTTTRSPTFSRLLSLPTGVDLVDDLGVPLDGQPGRPGCNPVRSAVRILCHTVEVRHEPRQVLEATPEPVDLGERDLKSNRFAHMDATRSAEGSLGVVGLGEAVHKFRPMPGDAAIQQGCRRRRHKVADHGPPRRADDQQQCAATKREPVFRIAQRGGSVVQTGRLPCGYRVNSMLCTRVGRAAPHLLHNGIDAVLGGCLRFLKTTPLDAADGRSLSSQLEQGESTRTVT